MTAALEMRGAMWYGGSIGVECRVQLVSSSEAADRSWRGGTSLWQSSAFGTRHTVRLAPFQDDARRACECARRGRAGRSIGQWRQTPRCTWEAIHRPNIGRHESPWAADEPSRAAALVLCLIDGYILHLQVPCGRAPPVMCRAQLSGCCSCGGLEHVSHVSWAWP